MLNLYAVTRFDENLNHRDVFEVADIWNFYFYQCHICLTIYVQKRPSFFDTGQLGQVENLSVKRVDLFGFDGVLFDRLGDLLHRHSTFFAQSFERGHHDVVAVHFEVLAQFASEV